MSQAIDDIMNFTADRLAGGGLEFALVVWSPGLKTGGNSIGVAYHPVKSPDAPTALALAAVQAEKLSRTESGAG